ncbi:MAG: hypothetical protein AAF432_07985 [Planctomycetota bacterium]
MLDHSVFIPVEAARRDQTPEQLRSIEALKLETIADDTIDTNDSEDTQNEGQAA